MKPRFRRLAAVAAVAVVASIATVPLSTAPALAAGAFQPIDPQNWENPDDMTWTDYVKPPGTTWADPALKGSVRNFRVALVTLDYPDQPFAVTQRARSTIFGNPQPSAANIPRDQVPAFYRDFLNTPGTLNNGHTLHEYWMEDSGGRYGVDLTAFGPYQLPNKAFNYGITNDMNPGMCPAGETCNRNIRTDGLGAWRAAVGDAVANSFEMVFILSAGQDESSTWQEFGQMRFQNKEDVPDAWGPPDPAMNNYARTRYVEWTSWQSAASIWPNAGGGSSTQAESSGMGVYAHELTHLLGIGDNYNNPYATPVSRAYTGIWSMMSRGSFNGPGGPHTRWQIPPVNGGSMGSQHVLRDKIKLGMVDEKNVLRLSREALTSSGIVVAEVTARSVAPGPQDLTGINIAMNRDLAPGCDRSTDPLCDGRNYNNYTVEVVDRMGADSFTPDSGVLISKTKNADNAPFVWVIDANPQDINMVDFYKPDGTPQMMTIGDYRQLSDALFHAGADSGSEFEYVDEANGLHFYIIDIKRDSTGVLSYKVAVQAVNGDSGPQTRGVALSDGNVTGGNPSRGGATCTFTLTNTGSASGGGQTHPEDVSAYLKSDVYRLSARAAGMGWRVWLPNELATAQFGKTTKIKVSMGATGGSAPSGWVHLTATSISDPTKTVTQQCRVNK